MAFWNRRNRKGEPVQVWTMKDGVQVGVPRRIYRHLDTEPDQVIDEWVARWSRLNEVQKVRPELTQLPLEWSDYIASFCKELSLPPKPRDQKTIADHKRHLEACLPYFAEKGCTAFSDFQIYSRKLYQWLLDQGKTEERVWKINLSLRLFWKFLDQKGLAESELRLAGGRRGGRKTPLKITISPEEILAADIPRRLQKKVKASATGSKTAKPIPFGKHEEKPTTAKDDIRLIMLLGYFFSLRPQEIFALRPVDFKAGSDARVLECCRVMEHAGFWNKLAVHIHRQKAGKKFKKPKADSKGWVACFDKAAAKEIVQLINKCPPDELLFKAGSDRYYKVWRQVGIENTVTKDMRRASLYHLGNNTNLPVVALKNHARHKNIETTMLYTRRPEDLTAGEWKILDMDA